MKATDYTLCGTAAPFSVTSNGVRSSIWFSPWAKMLSGPRYPHSTSVNQHFFVFKFARRDLDVSRAEGPLIRQQFSPQSDLLRQQQAPSTARGMSHEVRLKSSKIDFLHYKRVEKDSFYRYFVELDDAFRSCHIDDRLIQVRFDQPKPNSTCQSLGS